MDNTIQKPSHNLQDGDIPQDYEYDDLNYGADIDTSNVRIGNGHLSALLKLKPEQLPCPQELTEPTELPLQRESIGFIGDLSWRSGSGTLVVSQFGKFSIVLSIYIIMVSHAIYFNI